MISTARQKSKFRSLVRRLRIALGAIPLDAETVAIGILERLWHTTANDAIRGDIGRLTNEDIAEAVGWHGDADLLVQMLVDCRWLDAHDEYRLVVHQWHEHAPKYVKGNVTKVGGFVNSAPPNAEPLGLSLQAEPYGVGAPTQSYPIQSNPIQPNPTQPGGSVGLLAVEFDEVRRQGKLLRKLCPSLSTDFIMAVTWVAMSIQHGLIGDILESLRSKEVRKPDRYIESIMRTACAEAGHEWESLKLYVRSMKKEEAVST